MRGRLLAILLALALMGLVLAAPIEFVHYCL